MGYKILEVDKDKIKERVKAYGYNSYVQDVVCEYFLHWYFYKNTTNRDYIPKERKCHDRKYAKLCFDDLLIKDDILTKVIPNLIDQQNEFKKE